MLGQHPARHVVDFGVRFVAQCDQLRFTLAYGLAQARDDLVAVLDLTSQEDPIVRQTRDLLPLQGNRHALLLDHLAGIADPPAQGVDDRSVPGTLLGQRLTMLPRDLEHGLCMSPPGRVERAPGEGTRHQGGCDGDGDPKTDHPDGSERRQRPPTRCRRSRRFPRCAGVARP